MKKNARIIADDGANRLEINVVFKSRNGLMRDEVRKVTTKTARLIARQLKDLPYSDFGEENTRVQV